LKKTGIIAIIVSGLFSVLCISVAPGAFAAGGGAGPISERPVVDVTFDESTHVVTIWGAKSIPKTDICGQYGYANTHECIDGWPGMIFRGYAGAFGPQRVPDPGGFDHWMQESRKGMTPVQFANYLVGSEEFKARYGTVFDGDFVTLLYGNVLNRDVDVSGYSHHYSDLQSGLMSRAQLFVGFTESAENKGRTWDVVNYRIELRNAGWDLSSGEVVETYVNECYGFDAPAYCYEPWVNDDPEPIYAQV
jgi:hypothetical protein